MKSSFLLKVKAAEIVSSGFVTFSGLGLSMVLTRFFFSRSISFGVYNAISSSCGD